MIVDLVVVFIEPAEMHGTEEDIPRPLGEGFEADGELGEDVGDADPAVVPAHAPIGRDQPDFKMLGIGDRLEACHVGAT